MDGQEGTFLALTDSLPDPHLIVSASATIVAANRAAESLFGSRRGALAGRPLQSVFADHPDRLVQQLGNWARSTEPLPGTLSLPAGTASARYAWKGNLIKPADTGLPALILLRGRKREAATHSFGALTQKIEQLNREISERKAAERALRESEAQVRILLDSTGEAIYGVDREGNCTFANPAFFHLTGLSSGEVIGHPVHALVHHSREDGSPYPAEDCPIMAAHGSGLPAKGDEMFWRKDGSCFPVAYNASPTRRNGEILGSVVTFTDITARREVERKILMLNQELERRVEKRTAELEELNRTLTRSLEDLHRTQEQLVQAETMASLGGLVAGIAHEINTPVGVGVTAISFLDAKIQHYQALYDSGQLTRSDFEALLASTQEAVRIINTNLQRAADLVRSFKRVAVDQTSGERRSFDLKFYVEEVLQSLRPRLKVTRHKVIVTCPDGLEIYSHPGAWSQVFTNLITNSLVHGFEDKEDGMITIGAAVDEGLLRVEYVDNGKGIEPEHLGKIFDPFFTTKRSQGGAGLGLHIVYNLVTQTLGGTIKCKSREGEGTRFIITVPLRSAPAETD